MEKSTSLETRVINLLHDNHILHNSHSWVIYNGCKWMLDDLELTPDEWHDACKVIADYLGV